MIHIKNVKTLNGRVIDCDVPSQEERLIDASGLTLFPGLIDPHVHFRTPGLEHKETWAAGAKAAIYGGITTVFDMPNTLPASITLERILEKKQKIEGELEAAGIPLRFGLYLGADKTHFDQIHKSKQDIVGLKIFMGSSTGDLVMDDDSSLHAAFSAAASQNLLVAVHAEDEKLMHARKEQFKGVQDPKIHSEIRNREVALRATQKAIELAKIYGTRLYLLHITTKEEVELIRETKKEGYKIFAEATPDHLFFTVEDYAALGSKIQMNPPIRTKEDSDALWEGIRDGTIDTLGSDHAPHTLEEKGKPYGCSPSGTPGVQTTLPLMLNACREGKIDLKDIVRLMKTNPEKIFRLFPNEDVVLVDLDLEKTVNDEAMHSKCGWSPFSGKTLKGWPVYTILKGKVYALA